MSNTVRFLALAILSAPLVLAQSKKIEATDLPSHPFQAAFPSGGQLNMHLRSPVTFRVYRSRGRKITVRVEAKTRRRPKNQSSPPAVRSFRRAEHFRRPEKRASRSLSKSQDPRVFLYACLQDSWN